MSSGNSILFYFILIFIGFRLLVLAFKGLTGDALLSLSLSPSLYRKLLTSAVVLKAL